METTIVGYVWGCVGIVESNIEATIVYVGGYIGQVWGLKRIRVP